MTKHSLRGFDLRIGAVICSCGWMSFGFFDTVEGRKEHDAHVRSESPSRPRESRPVGQNTQTGRIYAPKKGTR